MRSIPAFREPAARLELLNEQGVDRTLMFPTLACLVEERLRDDPRAIHAVVHSLNEWLYETWQFNYADRIFTTPVITLPIVEKALEELDWVIERGAKVVLIRPAPVPGFEGSRSFGFPEFGASWVAPLLKSMKDLYKKMPQDFPENPIEAVRRCVYISPFWEENYADLAELLGEEHVLFGSDYPHPEGLAEPAKYADDLLAYNDEARVAKFMGGNLATLMGYPATLEATVGV
jgi:hypothetical protein